MPWYVLPHGTFDWQDGRWAKGPLSGAALLGAKRFGPGLPFEAVVAIWVSSDAPLPQILEALPAEGAPYTGIRVDWGPGTVAELLPPEMPLVVQGMLYRCRNDQNWTMEWVSPGALELTGYPGDLLVGEHAISYSGLIHPSDRELVQAGVGEGVSAKAPFKLRYRIRRRTGETVWVNEMGMAVYDQTGAVLGLVGHILAEPVAVPHTQVEAEEVRSAECCVLVVDDEASIVNLLGRMLERANYRVIRATNMEDALQRMAGFAGTVDVLLTDVVLERGSGCDLAEKLRQRLPHLKVIYMSGYAADGRVLEEVNQRRADFLSKPFLPSVAVEKIREVMQESVAR